VPLDGRAWGIVVACSLAPLLLGQVLLALRARRSG